MIPAGCVEACPGCKQRELSATESSAQKEAWVSTNLEQLCSRILPIAIPNQRWGYRRKATLHARWRENRWQFGLIRRRIREEIFIAIPECPVQTSALNTLFGACEGLPEALPLAFVQISGSALTLVLKSARSEALLSLAKDCLTKLAGAGAAAIFINWNPAAGRRVLSSRHMEQIYGPKFLSEHGLAHGPSAFRQQIPELEEQAQALAAVHLQEFAQIIDLYCGLGATLARWRKAGKEAIGVELVGEACELAEINAPGAKILKGKTEDRLPQLVELNASLGIFTNPPRDGHGEKVCAWLESSGAKRIAYLSCNMRSLRDDLYLLPSYEAKLVQPFDFFPQTDHVEALVLLQARGK
ncbi:MAG: class I SAM-dependent RNA methyltransferase [Bdellovibrionota bacterium]